MQGRNRIPIAIYHSPLLLNNHRDLFTRSNGSSQDVLQLLAVELRVSERGHPEGVNSLPVDVILLVLPLFDDGNTIGLLSPLHSSGRLVRFPRRFHRIPMGDTVEAWLDVAEGDCEFSVWRIRVTRVS